MKLRYIQFFAIIAWGIQSELLAFAIPMALIWEAQFLIQHRWTLTQQDFYRTADLTAVALTGIFIFLYLNRAEYHFLVTLTNWMPILIFPLVIVIAYSTTEEMTLDVLFYSLRRQKQKVTQHWDMNYLLFTFCILATATNKQDYSFYFPFSALLITLALMNIRSKRYKMSIWILLLSFSFLMAFGLQKGIRESHLELKQRAQIWLTNWVQQRNNPAKYLSAIGSVGQLKVSDKILFRVKSPNNDAIPSLLQETSYDLPSGNDWGIMEKEFSTVDHLDDFKWQIADRGEMPGKEKSEHELEIYLEFYTENAIVPLPPGTTLIDDLPALEIRQNYYGTIQAKGLVPSPRYKIQLRPGQNFNGAPTKIDTYVPERFNTLIMDIINTKELNADHAIDSLFRFFKTFRYSLYQSESSQEKPIQHFLQTSQAGHCEYFASSTVYLLRGMGIPARYVVGYSVQEYSELLDMYIVRQRHAHAWAIAYIDDKWQVVDTTPGIWLDEEAQQGFFAQPLFDLIANGSFMIQIWWNAQKIEDYENTLYGIGAILSLILMWRIMIGEKVIVTKEQSLKTFDRHLSFGSNSPFFSLEEKLIELGFIRGKGERLEPWLSRIGFSRFLKLLPRHNRWRFDPQGLSRDEKVSLEEDVAIELDKLNKESSSG